MNKLGAIIIVVGVVMFCYLVILVVMPVLTDAVSTANTTIAASANLTDYPGTQGFLLSTPWILFWVPGVIGMILVVIILKQP